MPSWSRIATRLRVPLGFGFAAAYLWFAHPAWAWIVAGSALVLVGLAIRAAASGHIRKNAELTTTGPYSYTRNPLYLGSIVVATGFVLAGRNVWIALGAALMFFIIYLPVIAAEEKYLRSAFAGYEDYAAHVPRLIPRLSPYQKDKETPHTSGGYSRELYWRHREYNAAVGSLFMMNALILKLLVWS